MLRRACTTQRGRCPPRPLVIPVRRYAVVAPSCRKPLPVVKINKPHQIPPPCSVTLAVCRPTNPEVHIIHHLQSSRPSRPPRRCLASSATITVRQLLPSKISLYRFGAFILLLIVSIVLFVQLAPAEFSDALLAQSIPLVLANLERFGFQELFLRFLVRASRDAALRVEFVQAGGIERVMSLIHSSDAAVNSLVAQILANVAEDEGSLELLVQAKLIRVMREVHDALATYDSPFAERVRAHTNAALALLLLRLGHQREHLLSLLQEVGLEAMADILSHPFATDHASQVILNALASLVQTPEWTAKILSSGGMEFLASLLQSRTETEVKRLALRCIANLSIDRETAYRVAREHGLSLALAMTDEGIGSPAAKQVARVLAHFARDEQLQAEIAASKGMTFLINCAQHAAPTTAVYALAALSNVAASEEGTAVLMSSLDVRALSRHLTENKEHSDAAQHIARMFANIASHPKYVQQLWNDAGPEVLSHLAHASVQLQPSLVRLIGAFAQNEDSAAGLLRTEWGWALIRSLLNSPEVSVRRVAVRALGNMAVSAGEELIQQPELPHLLRVCTRDIDSRVRADAIRAHASAASVGVKGPKFAEGIHLLYPEPSASARNQDFDVVFIHGVGGDPHSTWRGGGEGAACWPRDWLPKNFPRARIISVGYNIFLSRWSGDTLPLIEQSREVQQKLCLAGVGSRPVVFVTHSFGGLLLKQILRNADNDPHLRSLVDNTQGVVFYAVPHLGSKLTMYADYRVAQVLFRGSPALEDMRHESEALRELHKDFTRIAPHVSTLSFGENDKTCYGTESTYTCWQVVSDESAYPGFEGPMRHEWIKLDHNHRQVCKPLDESDPRYKHVADFIAETVQRLPSRRKEISRNQTV